MNEEITIPFQGESMYPSLKSGDELLVSDNLNFLEIGDIVVFKDLESKELIAHRIVENNPVMTKGDRSQFIDQSFPLLYKVIGIKDHSHWQKGQPFKKLIAKLSLFNDKKYMRPLRLLSISGIYFLSLFKNHK